MRKKYRPSSELLGLSVLHICSTSTKIFFNSYGEDKMPILSSNFSCNAKYVLKDCQCLTDPLNFYSNVCAYISKNNGLLYQCDPGCCSNMCDNKDPNVFVLKLGVPPVSNFLRIWNQLTSEHRADTRSGGNGHFHAFPRIYTRTTTST
jgi:hypothetical protein